MSDVRQQLYYFVSKSIFSISIQNSTFASFRTTGTVLYCTVPKTVTIAVDHDRDIFGYNTVHFVRGEGGLEPH